MKDLKEIFGFLSEIPMMMGKMNMPREKLRILQDIRQIIREWKEYKNLEEQGKLLKLPCAVGDTVYQIIFDKYTKCSAYKKEFNEYYCEECEKECDSQKEYHIDKVEGCHFDWILEYMDEFEKTIFFTREEAEAALKELESKKNE